MKMSNQEGSSEELNVIIPILSVDDEVTNNPNALQILLVDYNKKKENLFNQRPPSIFMIPSMLRDINPNCFTPRTVSIGPLHRGLKNLQEFEEQKTTFLHHLLKSLDGEGVPPEQTLELCLQKVNGSIDNIRACYAHDVMKIYSNVELAKMMVTDACFILQFINNRHSLIPDPSLRISILLDLVLVENQIPFFVLQNIFDCTLKNYKPSLTSLILDHFDFVTPFRAILNAVDIGTSHDHILGLLHTSFHTKNSIPSNISFSFDKHKRSATELNMAGVLFKPNEDGNWPLAMQFISSRLTCFCHCFGKHTLKLPLLEIYGETEQIFRNLIAFEHSKPDVPNYFTSYAYAMDNLIDTVADIHKLVESKVIINALGSNEDATNIINGLCTRVYTTGFYYEKEWLQLDNYCNGYWPKHIARLKLTYFNSPWNIIALIAGIILFSLTLVQTIFTIKGT